MSAGKNTSDNKKRIAKNAMLEDIMAMKIGDRLPNRNELAVKYGVARTTIERVVSELVGEGTLVSRDGSGTYLTRYPLPEGNKSSSAEEGNYLPPLARHQNAKPLWALLINDSMYGISPALLKGVEDVARENDYNLVVKLTDSSIEKQEEYLYDLLRSDVRGVIISPAIMGDVHPECFYEYKKRQIPIVAVGRRISGVHTPCVQCNSFEAGMMGTEHLLSHGCKRIAYISSYDYSTSIDRYQGYVSALSRAGIPLDMDLVYFDDALNEKKPGLKGVEALFSSELDFDGIYAFNDRVAYEVYKAASEKGITLGKDIALVTCDDTEICTMLPQKLTSVRQPLMECSRMAAKLLNDMCNGVKIEDNYMYILGNELIIRDSCGCNS